MTTATASSVRDAVAAYAVGFHRALGEGHHIASPFGAWLVLALAAPAAQGETAERLAEVLGMPVEDAAAVARDLLAAPPEAVAVAAAAWSVPATGDGAAWLDGLPGQVARGPVPSQAQADAWARENTMGLIETFPLDMAAGYVAVLASALATRIAWHHAFDLVGAGELRSDWRERVRSVLRTPRQGHHAAIVRHGAAGDLATHQAYADGLTVTSVIAGPEVAAVDVLAAAHDVAAGSVRQRSLFDLPVGDGPSWTITESDGDERDEGVVALLPAWSARSRHDLARPGLGFDDAASVLMTLFGDGPWDAVQAAMARYHRRGFEAAAVTALAVACSLRIPQPGRRRDALLRFDRPYAVVATVMGGDWHGLPVFSAWVTEPEEPSEG
jgi:hypothetical protein